MIKIIEKNHDKNRKKIQMSETKKKSIKAHFYHKLCLRGKKLYSERQMYCMTINR